MESPQLAASLLTLRPATDGNARVLDGAGAGADLARSWERSRRLGACADGAEALEGALVVASELREACERTAPLWHRARSVMEDFAATCARHDFVTLVSDARGIVTHAVGGGAFEGEARALRLVEGASWSESLRGTNAIGTALAEGRPVAVHGSAHFARVNGGLVCYAAPIRDVHGEIVAVLDATSRIERAGALDAGVVLMVARAVEEVLRVQAYGRLAGGMALVERLLESSPGPAFLVEHPGRIVRASEQGRRLAERVPPEDALLPGWDQLLRAASGDGRTLHAIGAGEHELAVEPLLDLEGHVLALLVLFGEPRVHAARAVPARPDPFGAILGSDPALVQARETCARLARSELPVLLLAETGSGKELFARAIHEASPRRDGPYVALNCGAIQPELLLSELFGHGPRAFTGADPAGRDGLLAAADGGTLFLDEVAELSLEGQVALLRVLEDGCYARVGEARERRTDIRIVAATCRDLPALMEARRFRKDLYFRIGGACVDLPPLRERSDLEDLVQALWARVRAPGGGAPPGLSSAALAALLAHDWPGNVRELESALDYAAVLAEGAGRVGPEHLPRTVRAARVALPAPESGELDRARRDSLLRALRESGGNVSAAARRLGVARSTVYRLAERLGVPIQAD